MGSWAETSAAGFKFEAFCLEDITKKKYPLAYKNMKKENFSYYDIILFDGNFSEGHSQKTVECKFDEKAHETGNICIEIGCNGRWSGLLLTKADFWLIADGHEMFLISRGKLITCIEDNMDTLVYKKKYPVTQEDGIVKDMDFYLVPKKLFSTYCLEVTGMNDMKYDKMV